MPKAESIQVAIRIRPPSAAETAIGDSIVCHQIRDSTLSLETADGKANIECAYGTVLGQEAGQEDVFEAIKGTIVGVAEGINGCIFTYGQTGAGKTHTMLGSSPGNFDGITVRAVKRLFEDLQRNKSEQQKGGEESRFHCSFLQIYNEKLQDLLSGADSGTLNIREHKNSRTKKAEVFVSGLSEYRVTGVEDVLTLLSAGTRAREVRATDMNDVSSRSHAVLQLSVEAESMGEDFSVLKRAKLSLVDLAGSEKMNTRNAIGKEHSKELTSINTSLSALGNVMSALGEKSRKHVPYRDSKLTRLLQDSLGGNTRTSVICCVSPCQSAGEETKSTLKFADRARRVMLHVRTNEVVDDKVLLARAQSEIARLRTLLKMYMGGTGIKGGVEGGIEGSPSKMPKGGAGGVGSVGMAVEDLVQENARLTEQNRVLRMALKRSEGGEGGEKGAAGGGQEKQSTYRVKKRLPGAVDKNMNEIYSGMTGSVGRKSPNRGQQSESEDEGGGADIAKLRRELGRKNMGGKRGKVGKMEKELVKVEEEHEKAKLAKERIRKEREELERQLREMEAAGGDEEGAGEDDDVDDNSMFNGDDSYAEEGFEEESGVAPPEDANGGKNELVLGVIEMKITSPSKKGRSPSPIQVKSTSGGSSQVKSSSRVKITGTATRHAGTSTGAMSKTTTGGGGRGKADENNNTSNVQSSTVGAHPPKVGGRRGRRGGRKGDRDRTKPLPSTMQITTSTLVNNVDAEGEQATMTYTMADLGMRVGVYSFRYDAYYPATVV
eukprot:CAMPEP_0118636212 /NCGR_PEP_ID=MMETSP0785-20121206/2494_1 /TAXON_ID=91992 /ORGANISM="Bolidomonas pacifica, Strain CCMP 1866" /LENGTH=774 /DNA_ID=CAMNT_0006527307 /DNA_START=129 /DNA_END=2450 /DNA_ORIENTATION=-